MKTYINALLSLMILATGCSKHETDKPESTPIIITIKPIVNKTFENDKWLHIIGGKGYFEFNQQLNDTLSLSSIKDSIDILSLRVFNKQLSKGTYDVSLKTASTAAADSFIRFNAVAKGILLDKDQSISLSATSDDGLITIHKKITATAPTFTFVGNNQVYKLSASKDYYFLYVKGGGKGRLTFTEVSSNDIFIKDLIIQKANRYDIVAVLNKTAIVQSSPFRLSN